MKKPRCFVAMAFERDDTDALYDRKIAPVLRRNGITAVIIDRRESTEDLNNQIIDQLDQCDFCIADLTYERPSVYFEAGYAQRVVPVIYTVRTDHIPPRSSPDGRVHFDLTMKPLIRWDRPSDKTFATRLERRIRGAFLRDWNRRQRESDALDKARAAFNRLAPAVRLSLLRRITKNAFKRLGFGKWRYEKSRDPAYDHVIFDDATGFHVGQRRDSKTQTLSVVKVKAVDALTKRRIGLIVPDVYPFYAQGDVRDVLDAATKDGFRPQRIAVHCIVIALQPVSTVRLESVLHNIPAGSRPFQYEAETVVKSDDDKLVHTRLTLDCMAPVKSEAEFRSDLRTLIPNLLSEEN